MIVRSVVLALATSEPCRGFLCFAESNSGPLNRIQQSMSAPQGSRGPGESVRIAVKMLGEPQATAFEFLFVDEERTDKLELSPKKAIWLSDHNVAFRSVHR